MALFMIFLVLIIVSLGFLTLKTVIHRTRAARRPRVISQVQDARRPEPIPSAAEHLSRAVQFASISGSDEPFTGLLSYLKETYPLLHAHSVEFSDDTYSLLFSIPGEETHLEPALLCAHLDVVPAREEGWVYPPFSGRIDEDFIWGRGSFDDKASVIALMETFERLLSQKKTLRRSWYIALGSDEEVRGEKGAALISSWFRNQRIHFAYVLDEGGAVAQGFIPQVNRDIAVIGLSEKSSLRAELTCSAQGGHSSTPHQPTSMGILARAVCRIEHTRLKGKITYPVKKMLETISLHSSLAFAIITANAKLFTPLILKVFSSSATMNALVRSTATVTMMQGSQASNIIPTTAKAVANIRALPGQSSEDILRELKRIVRDDRVDIALSRSSEPSRISPAEGEAFSHISQTIERVFPSAIAVPYLMTGASDALHYEKVSDHVYRFTPAVLDKGELDRMHSENERFSVENLQKAIEFYSLLVTE